MTRARIALGVLVVALTALAGATMPAWDVCAQATCRSKCVDEEEACLKRTGNKGQCGNKAKDCLEKCK